MKTIIIINGPNINLIGEREKKIYGDTNINIYLESIKNKYIKKKIELKIYYTNSESKIIYILQKCSSLKNKILGIIINAGAFTHTSLAISDTIKYISNLSIKILELHVSNIFMRENIRHNSLLSKNCTGLIIGFGVIGYEIAIITLIKQNKKK